MKMETSCSKLQIASLILEKDVKTNYAIQNDFFSSDVILFHLKYFFFIAFPLITSIFCLQSPLMVLSYWLSSKLFTWSVYYQGSKGVVVHRKTGQESNLTYIKVLLKNRQIGEVTSSGEAKGKLEGNKTQKQINRLCTVRRLLEQIKQHKRSDQLTKRVQTDVWLKVHSC